MKLWLLYLGEKHGICKIRCTMILIIKNMPLVCPNYMPVNASKNTCILRKLSPAYVCKTCVRDTNGLVCKVTMKSYASCLGYIKNILTPLKTVKEYVNGHICSKKHFDILTIKWLILRPSTTIYFMFPCTLPTLHLICIQSV